MRNNFPNKKCRFHHAVPALIQSIVEDRALPLVRPAPNAGTGIKSSPVDYGYGYIENLVQGR
jgi:hypothetical protein